MDIKVYLAGVCPFSKIVVDSSLGTMKLPRHRFWQDFCISHEFSPVEQDLNLIKE